MLKNLMNMGLVLALGLGVAQIGTNETFAATGGIKGAPDKDGKGSPWTNGNPPPGIAKKDPADRKGKWAVEPTPPPPPPPGPGPGPELAGAVTQTVCSTDLTDEQMRLCLGLPSVKKAPRIKRINVRLGEPE